MSTSDSLPVLGISRLRFGTDGLGVRTLIGTFGCPLRCQYCLNPDSWKLDKAPQLYTKEELYNLIKVDNLYFQATGGGLTFGGGEPALHAHFISDFIDEYCGSWSVFMETSLCAPLENIKLLENRIDKFIIDIKDMNPEIYMGYTGMGIDLMQSNLEYLADHVSHDKLLIRVPSIQGFNSKADVDKSISCLSKLGLSNIDCFSYVIRRKVVP